MLSNHDFRLRISLAARDDILAWTSGEVSEAKIHDARVRGGVVANGLFCENIFGPSEHYECACGLLSGAQFEGVECGSCGAQATNPLLRRRRMGRITLAAPVVHIWYLKGTPSPLAHLLAVKPKQLAGVVYFRRYLVTDVDNDLRTKDMPALHAAMKQEQDAAPDEQSRAHLTQIWRVFTKLRPRQTISPDQYLELSDRYGPYFTAGTGAETLHRLLAELDLDREEQALREVIAASSGQQKSEAQRRLKTVVAFRMSGNSPTSMILTVVPVLPPDLRPLHENEQDEVVRSDLNVLYSALIDRNNRLRRAIERDLPEVMVQNEKRMLQDAVDALFDNARCENPRSAKGHRRLTSLTDSVSGKNGRFRENLLGKRVDYSGRSVIIVGPQLKLDECGLPQKIALELFRPFIIHRLQLDLGLTTAEANRTLGRLIFPHSRTAGARFDWMRPDPASTVPEAARDVDRRLRAADRASNRWRGHVVGIVQDLMKDHLVLLNRAPTLHRLGVQGFRPVLVDGHAIQLHPLSCEAFNADFDGDTMAVHLPLSAAANEEARRKMQSRRNLLSPVSGRPLVKPRLDMVTGLYYLTTAVAGDLGEYTPPSEGRPASGMYSSPAEAQMALDRGVLSVHATIRIRLTHLRPPAGCEQRLFGVDGWRHGDSWTAETTLGRVLFNELLPGDYPFVDDQMTRKELDDVVGDVVSRYLNVVSAQTLDKLKDAGFYWATRSGVTVSMSDLPAAVGKQTIVANAHAEAQKIEVKYQRGGLTRTERTEALIDEWSNATKRAGHALEAALPVNNPLRLLMDSGATLNSIQLRTLAAMKGLVTDARGQIITAPVTSSLRDGLTTAEYLVNARGARKGLIDTAKGTAKGGYLTRRLVDVGQNVVIREADCGTNAAISLALGDAQSDTTGPGARTLADDVRDRTGNVIARAGTDLNTRVLSIVRSAGVTTVLVKSVLTCVARDGVCAACYGTSLATGKRAAIGEAIGIIAAQSIGEPATQLTLRTFHLGGVAGDDITAGLPRIEQLFEARLPVNPVPLAHVAGTVSVTESGSVRLVTLTPDVGDDIVEFTIPNSAAHVADTRWQPGDGDRVDVGQPLAPGPADPHEMLRLRGRLATQLYLVDEVQTVYRSQHVPIHSKHIEVIVRQMLSRVTVVDSGSTALLPGIPLEVTEFQDENRKVLADGGDPAVGRHTLLGITQASLHTDSWLSAASFQYTRRVLTDAAVSGSTDSLIGMKQATMIGALIPAGTGMRPGRVRAAAAPTTPIDRG